LTLNTPVILTDRLRLRAYSVDDLAATLAMRSDPAVTRFIGGAPSTEQQAWARIMNYAGQWALLGFGYWAVEEKESRRFIGELGFADFKRDIAPKMRDVPEIGWVLASEFHGKGYATEGVRAALAWADELLSSRRTVCMIENGNHASMRVAAKCGFTKFDQADYLGQPVAFLERKAGEQ
jgi:RimJ/RimL family protein N-acetyltransferase